MVLGVIRVDEGGSGDWALRARIFSRAGPSVLGDCCRGKLIGRAVHEPCLACAYQLLYVVRYPSNYAIEARDKSINAGCLKSPNVNYTKDDARYRSVRPEEGGDEGHYATQNPPD